MQVTLGQQPNYQVTATDYSNLVEGAKIQAFPDVSKYLGGIDGMIMPDTLHLSSSILGQCHLVDSESPQQQVESLSQLPPPLRDGCLFPIIVSELSRRQRELLSGFAVELPNDWTPGFLISGRYVSVLFSPRAPAQIITEYLLLRRALQISSVSFSSLIVLQNRDPQMPMFTRELLRLNAAAFAPLVISELHSAEVYLSRVSQPAYVKGWRDLVAASVELSLAPYRERVLTLSAFFANHSNDTRFQKLAAVYQMAEMLESFDNEQAVGEALVRCVLSMSVDSQSVRSKAQRFAAFIGDQSLFSTQLTNATTAEAWSCVASLPEIKAIMSSLARADPAAVKTLDAFPRFGANIEHAHLQLNQMLGSLEIYLSSRDAAMKMKP